MTQRAIDKPRPLPRPAVSAAPETTERPLGFLGAEAGSLIADLDEGASLLGKEM